MSQLTIYIDDETLAQITKAARREHESVSGWVKKRLTGSLTGEWPAGYFDALGSLRAIGFTRPDQPNAKADRKRESL